MKRLVAYVVVVGMTGTGFSLGVVLARERPEVDQSVVRQAPTPISAALSQQEIQILDHLNETRVGLGVPAVQADAAMTAEADRWAAEMAETGIRHSDLGDEISDSVCWQKLGENIAEGESVDAITEGWVASPTHYANLTDPAFTRVGVSVVRNDDGTLFAVQEFLEPAVC